MEQEQVKQPIAAPRGGSSRCRKILFTLILIPALLVAYLAWRFGADSPVAYATIGEHFKYGSTGGERESGFPYWIWRALPQVCAEHLPGAGYESLGMIYEAGKDLPVGISKRRHMGIDRVFMNCAVCHTSTLRDTPQSTPLLISGMPANTFNVMGFQKFFFNCAADAKFTPDHIIPAIQKIGGHLDLIDRYLVYPLAVFLMRDRVLMLRDRFSFIEKQAEWGPGRVDTFNAAKVIFNFPMDKAPAHESLGASDFPSIWNQRQRKGMQLHWDGNNDKVEERNRSAAFGTGTTPPTIDHAAIERIENWLLDFKPPLSYPYPIDQALAAEGAPIYEHYCAGCHGTNGQDFSGAEVGKVTPIEEIATDRHRLDSYTYELAVNQGTLYAGYEDRRFKHFRKTFGYANMPLDGLWLRAPYLHNGSVPTLRDLLEPRENRPAVFYRGYDVYDRERVGFVSTVSEEKNRRYFGFDTRIAGNSNQGHEGVRYGTALPPEQKAALVEYLKTF